MKKILAVLFFAVSGTALASNYVSIDVDKVNGLKGGKDSTAQYVRAGTNLGGIQFGLQSRTARVDGGGMMNSLELTAANNAFKVLGITPFTGVGYDNGLNATQPSYKYGLVGATTGAQVGPGFALVGVKTRVGTTEDGPRTKQTVGFGTYSIPVNKTVSLNLNVSRSGQTIKENAVGLGLGFKF